MAEADATTDVDRPEGRRGAVDLTRREAEVLRVMAESGARTHKAIARGLGRISPRTVEAHVTAIARKLPPDHEATAPPFLRVLFWAVSQEER